MCDSEPASPIPMPGLHGEPGPPDTPASRGEATEGKLSPGGQRRHMQTNLEKGAQVLTLQIPAAHCAPLGWVLNLSEPQSPLCPPI